MKRMLGCIAVGLIVVATAVSSQGTQPDPFNGTWKLNSQKSKTMTGVLPSVEIITTKITNGVMDYTMEYARGNEPHKKASYTAKYNDGKWVAVRNFDGLFSQLMLVKINDRLHYWLMRRSDGQAAGLQLRRMAEDGKSFTAVALGLDGNVQDTRVYEKQ